MPRTHCLDASVVSRTFGQFIVDDPVRLVQLLRPIASKRRSARHRSKWADDAASERNFAESKLCLARRPYAIPGLRCGYDDQRERWPGSPANPLRNLAVPPSSIAQASMKETPNLARRFAQSTAPWRNEGRPRQRRQLPQDSDRRPCWHHRQLRQTKGRAGEWIEIGRQSLPVCFHAETAPSGRHPAQ